MSDTPWVPHTDDAAKQPDTSGATLVSPLTNSPSLPAALADFGQAVGHIHTAIDTFAGCVADFAALCSSDEWAEDALVATKLVRTISPLEGVRVAPDSVGWMYYVEDSERYKAARMAGTTDEQARGAIATQADRLVSGRITRLGLHHQRQKLGFWATQDGNCGDTGFSTTTLRTTVDAAEQDALCRKTLGAYATFIEGVERLHAYVRVLSLQQSGSESNVGSAAGGTTMLEALVPLDKPWELLDPTSESVLMNKLRRACFRIASSPATQRELHLASLALSADPSLGSGLARSASNLTTKIDDPPTDPVYISSAITAHLTAISMRADAAYHSTRLLPAAHWRALASTSAGMHKPLMTHDRVFYAVLAERERLMLGGDACGTLTGHLNTHRAIWEPIQAHIDAKSPKRLKLGPFDEATRARITEEAKASASTSDAGEGMALLPCPELGSFCFADMVNQFSDKRKLYRAESGMP